MKLERRILSTLAVIILSALPKVVFAQISVEGLIRDIGKQIIEGGNTSGTTTRPQADNSPTTAQGSSGNADRQTIRTLQSRLAELGYDPGPADGLMGSRTRNAILAFEADSNLQQLGQPTPQLVGAVGSAWAARVGTHQRSTGQVLTEETVSPQFNPSFDCGRASTPTERAICASESLSIIDRNLAAAYGDTREAVGQQNHSLLLNNQRAFVQRRDQCGSDEFCLLQAMSMRIEELDQIAYSGMVPGPENTEGPVEVSTDEPMVQIEADSSITGTMANRQPSCRTLLGEILPATPASIMSQPGSIPSLDGTMGGSGQIVTQIFSSAAEDILGTGSADDTVISAGAGDDRILVFEASRAVLPAGEDGGDTIHLCSLSGPTASVALGSGTMSPDSFDDTLVVHPDVFRQATDLGSAQITVADFDPKNDRVVLRPSTAMEPVIEQVTVWDATVRAGNVSLRFFLSPNADAANLAAAIVVEPTTSDETVAGLPVESLLPKTSASGANDQAEHSTNGSMDDHHGEGSSENSGFLPDLSGFSSCSDFANLEGTETSAGAMFNARERTWRDGDRFIFHRGDGAPRMLQTGDGNDVIVLADVNAGGNAIAGHGSDIIVLCSAADLSAYVALDDGSGDEDSYPDTVVIMPSLFEGIPDGFNRIIQIAEYSPQNDVILIPSSLPDIRFEFPEPWTANVHLGALTLTMYLSNAADPELVRRSVSRIQDAELFRTAFANRTTNPEPEQPAIHAQSELTEALWANAVTLSGDEPAIPPALDACGDAGGPNPGVKRTGEDGHGDDHDEWFYEAGSGDDRLVVVSNQTDPALGVPSHSNVAAGAGNDTIFVFTSYASIVPGPGLDRIIVCAVDDLNTTLFGPADGSQDIIIIDQNFFATPIPDGFTRKLTVEGFAEDGDTLVLRVPAGSTIRTDHARVLVDAPSGETEIVLWAWYERPEKLLGKENTIIFDAEN